MITYFHILFADYKEQTDGSATEIDVFHRVVTLGFYLFLHLFHIYLALKSDDILIFLLHNLSLSLPSVFPLSNQKSFQQLPLFISWLRPLSRAFLSRFLSVETFHLLPRNNNKKISPAASLYSSTSISTICFLLFSFFADFRKNRNLFTSTP